MPQKSGPHAPFGRLIVRHGDDGAGAGFSREVFFPVGRNEALGRGLQGRHQGSSTNTGRQAEEQDASV